MNQGIYYSYVYVVDTNHSYCYSNNSNIPAVLVKLIKDFKKIKTKNYDNLLGLFLFNHEKTYISMV